MTEEVNPNVPQPTLEELVLGLMWEIQHLRNSIYVLTETVNGLNNSLREE